MKIHSRKELQNIATNHSADIDYKDLQRVCKRTVFLKIDTRLRARDSLRFRKTLFHSYKKTVTH